MRAAWLASEFGDPRLDFADPLAESILFRLAIIFQAV
jgi:hypothetical protein